MSARTLLALLLFPALLPAQSTPTSVFGYTDFAAEAKI